MTTQELYDLMAKGFDDIKQHSQVLTTVCEMLKPMLQS